MTIERLPNELKRKRTIALLKDYRTAITRIHLKVARYSFSRPIPSTFEHKLRRLKQSFGKIAITLVLDKNENLL